MSDKLPNPFQQIDANLASQSHTGARRTGLVRLLFGGAGTLVVAAVLWFLAREGYQPNPIALMMAAIPGAYALLGVMEAITGIPYGQLARRWDNLKGWQRGIYGTGIVLVAMVFIFLIMVGVVVPLLHPS
ncbi:hypothetical protein [Roseimicrobium sp. ORNL1]|uniref:hypothetical protein n=1 Tax=Roseimicrobium sp. ORNL1 TaxID=2711231 RepID=UPI0013E1EFA7|nr:hypothetical protein [Roseimicrobium sp. ORNL1]QIF00196.1 hypothetical protein G5S37_01210 [Roseimicrobium sp. ORNL1]